MCQHSFFVSLKRRIRQTRLKIVIRAKIRSEISHISDIGIMAPIIVTEAKTTVYMANIALFLVINKRDSLP